jgi:hypothetical protein
MMRAATPRRAHPPGRRDRLRQGAPAAAAEQTRASPVPCACGGGCPRCVGRLPSARSGRGQPLPPSLRARYEAIQHADFAAVRLHAGAPEVTGPLAARAVTNGQDIYFHPGAFRPGTLAGDALIGHELAHTLQTRASTASHGQTGIVSRPGDALERNADALARGERLPVHAAPAGALLRSPFDNETQADRARRERLLQAIDAARDTILRLLRGGGLLEGTEVPVERGGVAGVAYGAVGTADEMFSSYAERDTRLRRIVRALIEMATLYRSTPIPADFSAPTLRDTGEYESVVSHPPESSVSIASFGGRSAEWADLQAAYERYRITAGQTAAEYDLDWYYLNPARRIVPGAARGAPRIGRGVPTGAYMVVPDAEREPLRYFRLDGFKPIPSGSVIVEFWHDDIGYYYLHRGARIDVPSPWRR